MIDSKLYDWLRDILDLPPGTKVKVRAQNMQKNSKAARILRQRNLDADTVRWVWTSGSWYLGAFIRNVELDAGKIRPGHVLYGDYTLVARGEEYTFYKIGRDL